MRLVCFAECRMQNGLYDLANSQRTLSGHYSFAAKKIFTQWNMKVVLPADTFFVQINRAKRKCIILKHTSRFEIRHFRCQSRPPLTYFAENDACSLRSYRKTRSNLHIYVLDIL